MKMKKKNSMSTIKGFTLVEIMIVVAILGIISAIAVPSYMEYVKKGKRADAKVELLRIAQLQESYFVEQLSYAKDLSSTRANGGLGLGTTVKSEQEQYLISISSQDSGNGTCTGLPADSCASYTLTAAPLGGQASDKCGKFTLTNTGVKDVVDEYTSYDAKKCWK